MTSAELAALGLSDADLSKGFRSAYGFVPPMLAGDGLAAAARRREVFDRLMRSWYAPSPPPPPHRSGL